MSAYVIAQIGWHDTEARDRYLAAFRPLFVRHGGTVLAANEDDSEVIEGTWTPPGTVIMRFNDTDHARTWMKDPEFSPVAAIRHGAAETNLVLVEGLDTSPPETALDAPKPAYIVAQIDVHDPARYQSYLQGFMAIFERFGGAMLATSAKETEVIEGRWSLPRTVIMCFPSLDAAHHWHDDPDYQSLAEYRRASATATANLVLVEGLA